MENSISMSSTARQIRRVSEAANHQDSNGDSDGPRISADGRYVVFSSSASNLVPGDTNNVSDIFVADLSTGTIERVSVASDGTEANAGSSFAASISADGRYVAYYSSASNLVAGDTNGADDVFVFDRQTHTTTRVSLDVNGGQSQGASLLNGPPGISADGSIIAYSSNAANLVPGDTNGIADLFVAVRDAGTGVSIADVTTGEGNSGTHNAVFTITLSKPALITTTVSWTTADGSAKAGEDYAASSGTVTFNPGDVSKTINVPVMGSFQKPMSSSPSLLLEHPEGP